MEIIRRNTDYALRIVTLLAELYESQEKISAKVISQKAVIPYPLTTKLLQKLNNKGFVKSFMGPKGGFKLGKEPDEISFLEVIEAIQGPLNMNRCLLGDYPCPLKGNCAIHRKLAVLQKELRQSLQQNTLAELVNKKEGKYHEK